MPAPASLSTQPAHQEAPGMTWAATVPNVKAPADGAEAMEHGAMTARTVGRRVVTDDLRRIQADPDVRGSQFDGHRVLQAFQPPVGPKAVEDPPNEGESFSVRIPRAMTVSAEDIAIGRDALRREATCPRTETAARISDTCDRPLHSRPDDTARGNAGHTRLASLVNHQAGALT